ncbi:MAG: cupin domain-containing protein [Lachnospiraceae bacterium]|jgi:predicted cupin superfamily sugar epimerase|nr:cupin domain-containing protein [Lachnospiraceae bacterium]
MNKLTADEIIEMLGLGPMEVEGGMMRSTYRTRDMVGEKNMGSAIYFLLSGRAYSHMHRLPTDEVYHFYLGDPVEMLQLAPDGTGKRVLLGHDLAAGQVPQYVMPAGCWQGSRLADGGDYALMGTTMSPGFAPSDYEHGDADTLKREYPGFAGMIEKLTGETINR